jgi:hypothetical protein
MLLLLRMTDVTCSKPTLCRCSLRQQGQEQAGIHSSPADSFQHAHRGFADTCSRALLQLVGTFAFLACQACSPIGEI